MRIHPSEEFESSPTGFNYRAIKALDLSKRSFIVEAPLREIGVKYSFTHANAKSNRNNQRPACIANRTCATKFHALMHTPNISEISMSFR